MFVMSSWGRVGIMAGSEIWVLPWQVMVELEARQLGFWRRQATGEKAFLQLGLPVPRELGRCEHHEGGCAGGSTPVRKKSELSLRYLPPRWHAYLYWTHKVQQWKISEHSRKPKQVWFTLRRQALLSLFSPFCSSLSFCIWQSSLRYCLGCFPPCLLMIWMVKLHDRGCLDAGLLMAKTRLWAAKLNISAI